ncbi:MAG: sigma-54 dependent transcriptional regulator [candidate division WOR-3 bacterium]
MDTILVIDDDESIRNFLNELFSREGYTVYSAANGNEGWDIFIKRDPFMILLDQVLPDIRGIELLIKIKSYSPETNVIIITGYGEIKDAVRAMEAGALTYLLKPLDTTELRILIKRAKENWRIKKERDFHRKKIQTLIRGKWTPILFKSKLMAEIFEKCQLVAKTDTTVLLEGETGTGKGLFAAYLHQISNRSDGPFIDIDCTTIPENLLESELFGYEPGAFTDAKRRKEGLIELANNGTIFLDEIASLPFLLQGKLLKVIEERSFRKLGGKGEINVDVRIIVASNKDLLELTEKGLFRKDLYYRVSTFPIRLPPLRERKEDIIPLAEHFFQELKREFHKDLAGIESDALNALLDYDWPGNVRELRNTIEKAVILAQGKTITKNDIQLTIGHARSMPEETLSSYSEALAEFEKRIISDALRQTKGNQTRAAEILKVSRNFLIRQMKKYGINPYEYKMHQGNEV